VTTTTQPAVVGSNWGSANSPDALQFVNDDGWMITDGGIMATTDGGVTWHVSYSGPEQPTIIDFVGPEDGWALRNAGTTAAGSIPDTAGLLRTTDGGHTWSYLGEPSEGGLRWIDFTGPATGWALTVAGGLLTTTDGGGGWTAVPAPSAGSLCITTGGVVWLGVASGAVEESQDGGTSWEVSLPWASEFTPFDGPPIIPWMTCSGSAAWALYDWGEAAGSSAYVVVATADAGGHWAPIPARRNEHRVAGDGDRRVRRRGQLVAIDDRAGAAVERDQHTVVERGEDEVVGHRGGAERQGAAPSCPTRPCPSRG
jgi:hypothetical protein